MLMPGRKFSNGSSYKYGFAGKEKDDELKGDGNSYDFGARIYDTRVSRWLSTDPVNKAWLSPYQYASGNPVNLADPDGGDEIHFHYITIHKNIPIRGADGKFREQTIAQTYRYSQVIKDNNKDRFFVHRSNDGGKPTTIEFYPNAAAETKTGVTETTYILFGAKLFSLKDTDKESLHKLIDEFPEVKGEVLAPELFQAGQASWREDNKSWWQNFYTSHDYLKEKDAELETKKNFALGVLTSAGAEIAIGRLLMGAEIGEGLSAAKLYKAGLSPFNSELTNAGRAVTKHPSYFGFETLQDLQKVYKTTAEINELGASRMKDLLRAGMKTTGAGGRYPNGWVTYTLQNGNAASWSADGTFIGFRGVK